MKKKDNNYRSLRSIIFTTILPFAIRVCQAPRSDYMAYLEFMMTSSNGNIFRVTGRLCREFNGHRELSAQMPVTRSFCVFFDLRVNKRLSEQSWGWWFETLSRPLWRHSNVIARLCSIYLILPIGSVLPNKKAPCGVGSKIQYFFLVSILCFERLLLICLFWMPRSQC